MDFKNSTLTGTTLDIYRLDRLLFKFGFVRAEQWDYERVTYDRKFETKEGVYYFRLRGQVVEGEVEKKDALIELLVPLLGKHYYPHGVEYGDGENYPSTLLKHCEKILKDIEKEIALVTK